MNKIKFIYRLFIGEVPISAGCESGEGWCSSMLEETAWVWGSVEKRTSGVGCSGGDESGLGFGCGITHEFGGIGDGSNGAVKFDCNVF